MTQRTLRTAPSTRAPTRNATSGGRKSFSLDSSPRIHQGLALAVAAAPSSSRPDITATVFLRRFIDGTLASAAPARPAIFCCSTAKDLALRDLIRNNLPL